MSDLVEKYFREDLTRTEEEALEGLLSSSEDEAERFFAKAERDYFSFGLPDPAPSVPRGWLHPGTGWVGLAVLLTAVAAWWLLRSPSQVPIVRETAPLVAPSVPSEHPASVKPAQAVHPIEPKAGTRAVREDEVQPPSLQGEPDKTYSGIRVIVQQESTGPVVVRVLDARGVEVRRLYDGRLSAGQWSFKWDGALRDGTAAKPGGYTIEIDNGLKVLTREVEIRPANKSTVDQ